MKRTAWMAVMVAALLLSACKGENKLSQYREVYSEAPTVVYVAPVNDISMRRAVREIADSVYNASLGIAAKQLYLTASTPLTYNGYYVLGPLASAQLAATETRTGRQLRNESIADLHTDLGINAVLFIDLIAWKHTSCSWSVEVDYTLRSTETGSELMHSHVTATKVLPTDNKGNPLPLKEDLDFQQRMDFDVETAQRCRLVELVNQYVLKDLPTGRRGRERKGERYDKSHPEYYSLRFNRDGTVEMLKSEEL